MLINLGDIEDKDFTEDMKAQCEKLETDARKLADETIAKVKEIIKKA